MFSQPISCLSCKVPLCENGCPCGNHIRDIIALVKEGKEEEAASLLYSTNPFPEWTSLLCDHNRNCRGHCVLGRRGNPFDFPRIEAYLAANYHRPLSTQEKNGKKIAVIGAGPAGLSASFFLAKEGFEVHVYEKEESIGGVLFTGIPAFRYGKDPLKNIQADLEKMGVVFHLNQEVNDAKINEIRGDFEKIIVATGAEKENTLGYDAHLGVVGGLTLLYDLVKKQKPVPYEKAKKAVVWGGGNVAMDCARSLRRLGLDVTIVYRRGEEQMPASKDEIESCKEDGVRFELLTNIKELKLDENDHLNGAKLIRMELGEPDESGRASFHEIAGSEFESDFDLLVPALGEKVVLPFEISETDMVLAGDCRYGAYNIAAAIKDGREAAFSIINKEE